MTYKIGGRIVDAESRMGIGGLVVKAVDQDLFFDDLLGSTVTDDAGNFKITYEEEDFREFIEKNPDIVIIVKSLDRSRILYRSERPFRFPEGEEVYFEVEIPTGTLNKEPKKKEREMGKEIGKITLEINPDQLKKIVQSGRLEVFVETATRLFNRDLKAELVKESVSSIGTELVSFDDDEYGTGPRPPHWWNIGRIDALVQRLDLIEKTIGIKEEILETSQLGRTRGV